MMKKKNKFCCSTKLKFIVEGNIFRKNKKGFKILKRTRTVEESVFLKQKFIDHEGVLL